MALGLDRLGPSRIIYDGLYPSPPPAMGWARAEGGGGGRCQIGQFTGGPYAACVMCVSFQADPFLRVGLLVPGTLSTKQYRSSDPELKN